MPAKKSRQPAGFDIHRDFAEHVEASRRAREWAEKCIAYREAGSPAQAKNAELKARRWLRKAMILEARTSGKSRLVNRI
jgi:hypothetical protein